MTIRLFTLTPPLLAAMAMLCASVSLAQGSAPAPAAAPAKVSSADKHRQEDIAKHRKIAQAHEDAARCLESGEKETVCHDRMRTACQGLAIGKYCGMRHSH